MPMTDVKDPQSLGLACLLPTCAFLMALAGVLVNIVSLPDWHAWAHKQRCM